MDENNQNRPGMGGAPTGTSGATGTGSASTGTSGAASGTTSSHAATPGAHGSAGTTGGGASISGGRVDEYGEDAGKFDRAREFAQQKYQAASSAVRDQYTAVRRRVDEVDVSEVTGKARDYVRANPGKALLASVAAGFVIGLLFRQGDDE